MSIYTIDQLVEKVKTSSRDELEKILINLLSMRLSESMHLALARFIMDTDLLDKRDMYCQISAKKAIPYKDLKKLSQSPLMGMTFYFIEAVLKPGGPYQTQDVMANAAMSYKKNTGKKAFYMNVDGIDRTMKVYVGYILTMAGFEKVSTHVAGQTPVKAWKPMRGITYTPKQRQDIAESTVRQEINKAESALKSSAKQVKAQAPKAAPNIMDLI